MTIQSALREGYSILFYAEVETPLLDCTVLLAEALEITRETLFASLFECIDKESFTLYKNFIDKRCRGIPVSYIRKRKEFYGLEFYVDERVLVPRPDTETVVDTMLSLVDKNPEIHTIHDACTGSGCIAISLKYNRPELIISASDISPGAEEVFFRNARNILGEQIPFYCSDLLQHVDGCFDSIVANPPYLSDKEVDDMKKIGWPEPGLALRGGPSGVSTSHLLIQEALEKIRPGGFLVLESCPSNMKNLVTIMDNCGFTGIFIQKDLGARDRVILGRRPWDK